MSETLALSIPQLNGKEWKYVKDCLDTGWVSTAGHYVNLFEEKISQWTKARHAVVCNSGTSALHIALIVAGVKPDDEVITPTVTFIAPINVVRYCHAHPVFMDCDEYYNMHAEKTIDFIKKETRFRRGSTFNKKTKRCIRAILPVHVFGHAARCEELIALCRERNIKVIEDATESLGTVYTKGVFKGMHTGLVGDIGCLSFNGNKIITTGGGGMVITQQARWAQQAKYLTTQAKDDDAHYIHNAVGYNYRLNNLQAALGVAQVSYLRDIIKIKKQNYHLYKEMIDPIEGLYLADMPPYAKNNHWMYALQIDEKKYGHSKDELMAKLAKENIDSRSLWYLNHLQKPYRKCQRYWIEQAPVLYKKTLNIPCSAGLRKKDIHRVLQWLKKWKR